MIRAGLLAASTSTVPGELYSRYGAKLYLGQVLAKEQILRA